MGIPPWVHVKILSSLKALRCIGAEVEIEEELVEKTGKELVEIPSELLVTAIVFEGSENGVCPVTLTLVVLLCRENIPLISGPT